MVGAHTLHWTGDEAPEKVVKNPTQGKRGQRRSIKASRTDSHQQRMTYSLTRIRRTSTCLRNEERDEKTGERSQARKRLPGRFDMRENIYKMNNGSIALNDDYVGELLKQCRPRKFGDIARAKYGGNLGGRDCRRRRCRSTRRRTGWQRDWPSAP